ncbi:helix-turn-helix transcriptional regulator [Pseudomaricurvus alcaniphilus]|uniref:helix-turn-helix domain-containing protein n=1 Tax=Pseudomaricurvus alcaniphilus TaxID=1166482 RepID=UPI00140CB02A|nr:helix-turn-helix transcriptional regulator [Pseudomaricurvus alcaniphilus]NHN39618.1 helix-turn-helix transcriptional regulator [Pseudomaricurvus alcaniphilus]
MKDEEILKNLGACIRRKRKEAGFTQEEFAHAAGFERAYYGRVERGTQNLTILNLFKIASALNCNASDLIEGL